MSKNVPVTGTSTSTDMIVDTITPNLDHASFTELMTMFDQGGAVHVQELEDRVPVDKDTLIGTEMVITDWRLNPQGEMGPFVVVKVTTKDGHCLFTDGSTGIKEQLQAWADRMGGIKPIYVPCGLRKSDYTVDDPFKPGSRIAATTYYISNETK